MKITLPLLACLCAGAVDIFAADGAILPPAERAVVLSESLARIPPEMVQKNPKLKETLDGVIVSLRGTPQFVQLVQRFGLANQSVALLEFALKNPSDDLAVTAMRLVLAGRDFKLAKEALNGAKGAQAVEALGNLNNKRAVGFLIDVVTDSRREAALRQKAVRALAQTQEGGGALIALAKAGTLPGDVQKSAGEALRGARTASVREEAAKLFAAAVPQNTAELPPVSELLKRTGNSANGAKVFRRETVGCINCHQVNGEGKDFGPALSEIGTKLGKDVLYQSIIDPSAGISLGFESWSIELKNGDEFYGLIVNETENELTIKDARAIPTVVKKADIAQRTQSKLSIMPAGLPQSMTTQELVDLVDYLATLKKK